FVPAAVLGAFAAALAAVAAADAAEPGFGSSLHAPAALFLHLFLADLVPAGLIGFAVARVANRSRAPGAAATALRLAVAALVFSLWTAGTYGLAAELSPRALLWGIPVGAAALLAAAAARLAFLARAFERSGALPARGARRLSAAAAATAIAVAALL